MQFAGIDEPDDVVNLTHQELFMRGGFIMFDRAALELLTICTCIVVTFCVLLECECLFFLSSLNIIHSLNSFFFKVT